MRSNPGLVIRNETDADIGAITEVTMAAFETLEISNHTEQFIIEALRAAKALAVSLVAELDGRVNQCSSVSEEIKSIRHRFSRITLPSDNAKNFLFFTNT